MERHNIEAINAAWQLGDLFMPPAGTVIRIDISDVGHIIAVTTGKASRTRHLIGMRFLCNDNPNDWSNIGIYLNLDVRSDVTEKTIIYIPATAPLFEDWERF